MKLKFKKIENVDEAKRRLERGINFLVCVTTLIAFANSFSFFLGQKENLLEALGMAVFTTSIIVLFMGGTLLFILPDCKQMLKKMLAEQE